VNSSELSRDIKVRDSAIGTSVSSGNQSSSSNSKCLMIKNVELLEELKSLLKIKPNFLPQQLQQQQQQQLQKEKSNEYNQPNTSSLLSYSSSSSKVPKTNENCNKNSDLSSTNNNNNNINVVADSLNSGHNNNNINLLQASNVSNSFCSINKNTISDKNSNKTNSKNLLMNFYSKSDFKLPSTSNSNLKPKNSSGGSGSTSSGGSYKNVLSSEILSSGKTDLSTMNTDVSDTATNNSSIQSSELDIDKIMFRAIQYIKKLQKNQSQTSELNNYENIFNRHLSQQPKNLFMILFRD
jgi:hypothetical protein